MNIFKKILIIFLIFIQTPLIALSATQATQILNMGLPEVLEIEKIIVDDVEHNRNAPMPNMVITNTNKVNNQNTILTMTPVQVKIHTNLSTPIIVNAQFTELKHIANPYQFEGFNLSISPTSYTITNPFDHVITDEFIPYAVIKPNTVLGDYIGTLLFTLGALWKNI